jgi:hypothetical protein
LKGILPANHSFQGGEKLILFQIGLFNKIEETNEFFENKPISVRSRSI